VVIERRQDREVLGVGNGFTRPRGDRLAWRLTREVSRGSLVREERNPDGGADGGAGLTPGAERGPR